MPGLTQRSFVILTLAIYFLAIPISDVAALQLQLRPQYGAPRAAPGERDGEVLALVTDSLRTELHHPNYTLRDSANQTIGAVLSTAKTATTDRERASMSRERKLKHYVSVLEEFARNSVYEPSTREVDLYFNKIQKLPQSELDTLVDPLVAVMGSRINVRSGAVETMRYLSTAVLDSKVDDIVSRLSDNNWNVRRDALKTMRYLPTAVLDSKGDEIVSRLNDRDH